MVNVDAVNSDIKCSFSTLLYNKYKKLDFFLKELCNDNKLNIKSTDEQLKEKDLMIYLLDNISFLNRKDDYGKFITNCDLNKIYNLK